MPRSPQTHELRAAVGAAIQLEHGIAQGDALADRLKWLPESELVARMRSHLLAINGDWAKHIRICAAGKKPENGTLHDLEVRVADGLFAVEAVFCLRAKGDCTQYVNPADLNPEVAWFNRPDARYVAKHFILFFPPLVPGYLTDGRNAVPSDPDTHQPIALTSGTFLLSHSLQAPGLSQESKELLGGIIRRVDGRHGAREKWTVVLPPVPTDPRVVVLGDPSDPLWAVAASSTGIGNEARERDRIPPTSSSPSLG